MKYCIDLNFNHKIPDSYIKIDSKLTRFPCGEFEFEIYEDISDKSVTIFQSFTVGEFSDDIIKLQIVCDALNSAGASNIKYFAPFLPYTRQDKYRNGLSFGAKIFADIVNQFNISEISTYDIHSEYLLQLFKCECRNLSIIPEFISDIKQKFNENTVIIFPDRGSELRFHKFFEKESIKTATISKIRLENGIKMEISADLHGKVAIIIDDIIDSGDTIINASKLLIENGAVSVCIYATHAVFSGNAISKIEQSAINTVTISNSVKNNINQSSKINTIEVII